MSDKGRGWYGDEEGHRKAAKKARQGPAHSAVSTFAKYTLLLFALPFRLLSMIVPSGVRSRVPDESPSAITSVTTPVARTAARFNGPTRRVGNWLFSGLNELVTLPFRGLGFLGRQARGTRQNTSRTWDYLTFDNILPPSVVDLIQWVIETTPKVLGIRGWKPWHQIGAAISLLGVAFLSTALSGGVLIGTLIGAAFLLLIGIVRLVPAANDGWNEWTAALSLKNDYDVPRWKRD